MSRQLASLAFALSCFGLLAAASAEKLPYANSNIAPPSAAWCAAVEKAAPQHATVKAEKRKLLVFSRITGYKHEVTPHVDRVFEILGKKTGAFDVTVTRDIEQLAPDNLAKYDVLVLNNNCSKDPRRNLLLDVLESDAKYSALTKDERQAKAKVLEQSMLDFVAGGKGVVAIHGAITMLNHSKEFTKLLGAEFQFHASNQELTVRAVEPDHPLLAAFRDAGPLVHRDEPYCFQGEYEAHNFRPLLEYDADKVNDPSGRVRKEVRYIAWIKPYGKGRVFYCSPSHFPESYESPTLLRFLLDGTQYAAGDLKCEDQKRKSK